MLIKNTHPVNPRICDLSGDLFALAIQRCKEYHSGKTGIIYKASEIQQNFIRHEFSWSETLEGAGFWKNVYDGHTPDIPNIPMPSKSDRKVLRLKINF